MERERKYQIALAVYRTALRENGIRFFPKQAEKEVSKITKLALPPAIGHFHVRHFLAEEYARLIYGELNITRDLTGVTLLSENLAGPIALACLMNMMMKEGIQVSPEDFKKKVGVVSKATGISKGELLEFYTGIITDFFQRLTV